MLVLVEIMFFCRVFLLFPGGSIYLLYYFDQLDGSTPTFLQCLVAFMDNFQSQQPGEAPEVMADEGRAEFKAYDAIDKAKIGG